MKKIFYGWYIVAAALMLMILNSILFAYGFTAFMTPIIASLGYSSAQVSLASSIRGLEAGTLDPFVGAAADRWPARRMMLIGIVIFSLGIFCISRSTSLGMFYGGFLIVGLGGAIGIQLVPTTVVARWFKKKIGKVSGIMATGVAAGGIFTPLIVKAIDAFTWQNFLLYLAIGMLVVGIPIAFLFRDRPEDYGLLPDGEVQDNAGTTTTGSIDYGVSVKEAVRTRAFWLIGIGATLQMLAMHAVTLHIMLYLESIGFERDIAALSVTIFSIITIVSRLLYGIVADIYSKKYVLASSMLLLAIGLVIFHFLDGSSFAMVVVFAVIYGIGAAGAMPLRVPIIREYFGVKKFGTIFGLNAVFLILGSAIGAPVVGWYYDTRGVYSPVWLICAGLAVVGMILMLILPPPPGKETSTRSITGLLKRGWKRLKGEA
ncbi:MFS transporter [Chloroflexota bacterium]